MIALAIATYVVGFVVTARIMYGMDKNDFLLAALMGLMWPLFVAILLLVCGLHWVITTPRLSPSISLNRWRARRRRDLEARERRIAELERELGIGE